MSKKPLISIITAAYNHERYVGDTIKSIIAQDYENLEYIIVDDGSPDGTKGVIQSLASSCQKRFQRFVFLKQKNQGSVTALNNALEVIKGKYAFILASDDLIEPDAISTLYNFLSQNSDYALAVSDNKIIDGDGNPCFWGNNRAIVYDENLALYKTFKDYFQMARPDFDFNSDEFGTYSTLIKGNYFPCGSLIRKGILDRMGGFTTKAPLEDLYLVMQISKNSKLKYIDSPLVSYRWHNNNTALNTEKMYSMALETYFFEEGYCRNNGYLWDWYLAQTQNIMRLVLKHPLRLQNYTFKNLKIVLIGFFPMIIHRIRKRIIGPKD